MYLLIALFLNYYAHCQGLQDSLLKQALSDSIRQGVRYEYGTNEYHSGYDGQHKPGTLKAYGTWQALIKTDIRDDGTVWDMYSNSVHYFTIKEGESACNLQIEHCLPKSWWGWEPKGVNTHTDSLAYKDLFNLNPADAQANGQKSNFAPGKVPTANKFDNGVFRMNNPNTKKGIKTCFEPADEYKGDFARSYFYIVTAYPDASWSSDFAEYVNPQHYTMLSDSLQRLLLEWHRNDPVSEKEIHRASVITSIQHNHNPYIDYPDLVEYIWGNKQGQAVDFNLLECTYDPTYVPPVYHRPQSDRYDTLFCLYGLTLDTLKKISNCTYANLKALCGSQNLTMGSGENDGYVQFSKLSFADSAWVSFRASIFKTAANMQIDIYTNSQLLCSVKDSAIMCTRNEQVYTIALPANTTSIKLVSVGGSTTKRACLQEFYLLTKRKPTNLDETTQTTRSTRKIMHNQKVYIHDAHATYNILGQTVPSL